MKRTKKVKKLKSRRKSFEGLLNSEDQYRVCTWSTAPRYEVWNKVIHPMHEEGFQCCVYHPLEVPNLITSFARFGVRREPSKEKVKGWVSKYGLLTRVEEKRPHWEYSADDKELIANQAPLSLEDFAEHARSVRGLLDLYSEVQRGDVQKILQRIESPDSSVDTRLREHSVRGLEGSARRGDLSKNEENEIMLMAVGVLIDEVNEKISGVRLVAEPNDQRATTDYGARRIRARVTGEPLDEENNVVPYDPLHRFKQGWTCPDLLTAIYFQYYMMITNNTPLRRCENPRCNMPFSPSRKDNKLCCPSCKATMSYHRRKGLRRSP